MAASYPSAIKTFSTIVNGVTKLVAALFNSPYDEITAIETALGTNMSNVRAGAWVDKSASYAAQQATTDGFLVGYGAYTHSGPSGTCYVDVYTDGNADPTTLRQRMTMGWSSAGYVGDLGFTVPVKKSDYWKVVVTALEGSTPRAPETFKVYWIPLGG